MCILAKVSQNDAEQIQLVYSGVSKFDGRSSLRNESGNRARVRLKLRVSASVSI